MDVLHETTNPFSTRCIRPGAIPFVFAEPFSLASILTAAQQNNWWGEIIGPHGSGKSTLLANLHMHLQDSSGLVVHHFRMSADSSTRTRWQEIRRSIQSSRDEQVVLLVDGYEQLSLLRRWNLKRMCRRANAGLIITAHQPMGLVELYRTEPTLELCLSLVDQLLPHDDRAITRGVVASEFLAADRDIRETFFRLYDVWEQNSMA